MKKRDVIEIVRTNGIATLTLSCGHTVERAGRGRLPKAVACSQCAACLEACRSQAGWFSARQARVPRAALEILEGDGLLLRSSGIRAAGIRWRVMGTGGK